MENEYSGSSPGHQLSLNDIIDINVWQTIHDNFSNVTEVRLRTVDAQGNPVTQPSRGHCLCCNLIKNASLRNKFCARCLPTFLGGKGILNRNLSFLCSAGLYNFVAPLRVEHSPVLVYLIIGPVILVMRKPKEEYRSVAEELHVSLEDLWNAILEIKVVSFQVMNSLVELIKGIGEYTLKLGYQKVVAEATRAQRPFKLNQLLDALLDVAFQITGADIGSVMLLDKEKEGFTIQAARGLPDEIARNTRVKLGEGISGIAAQKRTSFLIDDEIKENRIRRLLNRPYIASSMVVPITAQDRAIGVMNLAALKTSAVRFNTNNVESVNKLINLVSIALQ